MSAGFTFDGTHSDALGVKVLYLRRSVLPRSRHSFESIPGRPGTYVFPEEPGDRQIVAEVGLVATTQTDLIAQERAVAEWLRPTTRKPLVLDDDPDWYLNAIVGNVAEVADALDLGPFSIEFECEPFVYALNEASASVAMGASATFDLDEALDTPPRIVVYAASDLLNPSVTLGGATITYQGTIDAGEAVVWDSEDFWSLLFADGGPPLLGAWDPTDGTPVLPQGTFPTVTTGANVVTTEAADGTGTMAIFWRPRRL